MFHLSLFITEGAGGAFTLQDMTAVPDPAVPLITNGHIVLEANAEIQMAYAFGEVDISAVQISTPSLRPVALPNIRPFDAAVAPSTRPPICNLSIMPIPVLDSEELGMQISATTGTNLADYYGAVWLSNGIRSRTQGKVYQIGFTATITANVETWTSGVMTLANTLPPGMYMVVGMDVWGTNLDFARLIFPNQQWRPGILAGGTAAFINAPCFRDGKLGDFGSFRSYAPPQLDIYAIGANSAQAGVLDIVKIG